MMRDIRHLRHLFLFFFDQKKTQLEAQQILTETYSNSIPDYSTSYNWFCRFERGDIDFVGKSNIGARKLTAETLQKLLDENPHVSIKELTKKFNVCRSTINFYLKHLPKKYHKRKLLMDLLTQIRYNTCVSLLSRHYKQTKFLDRIVFGNRMTISYNISNQTEASTVTKKKIMLCIWWDKTSVLYCKMLKLRECYDYPQQLNKLRKALDSKQPQPSHKKRTVILVHNDLEHIGNMKSVKQQILEFGWEVLLHPADSFDISPSYGVSSSLEQALKGILEDKVFQSFKEVKKYIKNWIYNDCPSMGNHILLPEKWKKCVTNKGKITRV